MFVVGIETSCDETGLAIYDDQHNIIVSEALNSQIDLHAEYGGVVPELASRDHVSKLIPLMNKMLEQANLSYQDIGAVAYTAGPGLIGALMVGAAYAKALAFALKIPSIGVHHLEGHLLAPMLADCSITYPFLTLLVSGGHTQLIKVTSFGHYEIMGETLDDAVGEAFDKTAKLIGLGYPGGPALEAIAKKGIPGRFNFPRPMTQKPGLNFSFSGLKTAVLTQWQQSDQSEQTKADICHAFEQAVVDTLCIKCSRAIKHTGINLLVVAGGVSANQHLRSTLKEMGQAQHCKIAFPPLKYCTDNGAMIALAGALRLQHGFQDEGNAINVKARWPLKDWN